LLNCIVVSHRATRWQIHLKLGTALWTLMNSMWPTKSKQVIILNQLWDPYLRFGHKIQNLSYTRPHVISSLLCPMTMTWCWKIYEMQKMLFPMLLHSLANFCVFSPQKICVPSEKALKYIPPTSFPSQKVCERKVSFAKKQNIGTHWLSLVKQFFFFFKDLFCRRNKSWRFGMTWFHCWGNYPFEPHLNMQCPCINHTALYNKISNHVAFVLKREYKNTPYSQKGVCCTQWVSLLDLRLCNKVLYHDLRYDKRVELFAADADVFGQHVNPLCLWETADLQNHSTWKQHTSSVTQSHSPTPAQTWDTVIFTTYHDMMEQGYANPNAILYTLT